MPKGTAKRVVVDANVARSAGDSNDKPCSFHSRQALMAIRDRRLNLVLCPVLETEWRDHESNFSRKWRVSMQQRGLIYRLDGSDFARLGKRIGQQEDPSFPKDALIKDLHVFASALATDRIVVSNEVRLRNHLVRLGDFEPQILLLLWASPLDEGADCTDWLAAGAKPVESRLLKVAADSRAH